MSIHISHTANTILRTAQHVPGPIRLRVISNSMFPWLRTGDVVLVRQFDPEEFECGDVIVVWQHDQLITHRLILVDKNGWWTKGDKLFRIDCPVQAQDVFGKVISIVRYKKSIDLLSKKWLILNRILGRISLILGKLMSPNHNCSNTLEIE